MKIRSLFVATLALLGLVGATQLSLATAPTSALRTAVFAGGCFWCVEAAFDEIPGVSDVVSGYTGGRTLNPTYEQVSAENTGHAESVQVTYDPAKISYARLLDIFWRNIDPLDAGGQFCDRGDSYRSEIFVATPEERALAEQSKAVLEKRFGRALATRVTAAARFYPAEGYHQDYHRVNPLRYRYYRSGCGRDARLDRVWGAEARPKS